MVNYVTKNQLAEVVELVENLAVNSRKYQENFATKQEVLNLVEETVININQRIDILTKVLTLMGDNITQIRKEIDDPFESD